jgi:soluble epoxide hydrolase/lipid-phosphate phosphatase
MGDRIRSTSELWQYLAGAFLAQGPSCKAIATAIEGTNWENLPKLGKSPLLGGEEIDYYMDEYARHGLNRPLNWYRNRQMNFVDGYQFFLGNGENLTRNRQSCKRCCYHDKRG